MAFFINIFFMIERLPAKRATGVFNTMRVVGTVPDTRLRKAARAHVVSAGAAQSPQLLTGHS